VIDLKLQKLFKCSLPKDNNRITEISQNLNRLERLNAINSFRTLRKNKTYEREREVA